MAFRYAAVLLMCAWVATGEPIDGELPECITKREPDYSEFIGDVVSADVVSNVTEFDPQHATDSQLESRLYESLYYDNYDKAVELCKSLVKERRKHVIKATVDYLLNGLWYSTRLAPFAYKLWAAKGGVVVENLFPDEFEMVFDDSFVVFTNYWYHVPIELGIRTDFDGDKQVLANARNPYAKEFVWKLEPAHYNNKIYFKIRHKVDGKYMKLAKSTDRDGDYLAYASPDSDTDRHLWLFQPVKHDGEILFYIINLHHYQALKLALRAYDGYREVFGIGGDFYNYAAKYGWRVQVLKDGRVWKGLGDPYITNEKIEE